VTAPAGSSDLSTSASSPTPAAGDGSVVEDRRTLRPTRADWPLWLVTAGLPVAFVLGFHGLAWPFVAVVLGLRLVGHSDTRVPWSAVPLALYLGWSLLSVSMISPDGLPMFSYRWLLFLGALVGLVWVVNIDEATLPTRRIVDWLAALWVASVAFGYLAQLLPDLQMPSPVSTLLGPVGRIDFVARISDWNLADNQEFGATAFARPAAPWAAANSWGAAVAILTPFFVRSWLVEGGRRRRRVGFVLLAAAAVPVLMSANRGLWVALVVGLAYFTARKALRGRFGALAVLFGALLLVGGLLVTTPAGDLVQDRVVGSTDSDAARSQLYVDAWEGAVASPLIGNGEPRATTYYESSPPVGTHGLLWYLLFVHGFVGVGLFLAWLATEVLCSGRVRTPLAWWAHLSLVLAVVEVPFYGLQPHVLLVGVIAGVAHREARRRPGAGLAGLS
jgi:polysaccharide biosynthesis protein PslJ